MNYPLYGNQFYMQDLQNMRDRIDSQMRQMQNQPVPVPQQPITQNFQLAPNPTNNELESKYVDNIDEVRNTFVMKTGIFANKDFSTIWIKDVTGNIRTFRTEEIIEMDEKDREIFMLRKQIEDMKQNQETKGEIVNANERINADINEPTTNKKSSRVQNNKYTNAKQ